MNCSICYEPNSSMIACQSCLITVCASCYIEYIKSLPFQNATLKCVNTACLNCHTVFGLSRIMNEADFECFMSCVIHKQRLLVEMETIKSQEEIQQRALMIGENEKRVIEMVNTISELLTPQCPNCSTKFDDFDGCFSVKCRTCNMDFCGWCMNVCGESHIIHMHATNCPSKEGINHERSYYGTKEQFEYCFASKIVSKLNTSFNKEDNVFKDAVSRLEVHLHRHRIYLEDGVFHAERTIEYPNIPFHNNNVQNFIPEPHPFIPAPIANHPGFNRMIDDIVVEPMRLLEVMRRNRMRRDRMRNVREALIREAEERDPDPDNKKPRVRLCSCCHTYARHDKRTCPERFQQVAEPVEEVI